MIVATVFIGALLFVNVLLVIDRHRVIYFARSKHIDSLYNVKTAFGVGIKTGKRILDDEIKNA